MQMHYLVLVPQEMYGIYNYRFNNFDCALNQNRFSMVRPLIVRTYTKNYHDHIDKVKQ